MATPVSVKIITNTKRNVVVASDSDTPKELLRKNEVDFATATVHLDGAALSPAEMNTTFEKLGITESCILACAMKTTNA